jgi:Leucine-rich repeat (LRR) protein
MSIIDWTKRSYQINNICHKNLHEIPKDYINPCLTELCCYGNKLRVIPNELINLQYLNCNINLLNNIPNSLINLKTLVCSYNNISSIPDSLINLRMLICSHNDMIYIPDTLINLKELYCFKNENLKIPILKTLEVLVCHNCEKFKKAGIFGIKGYKKMIKNYNIIMPFLIGIKKRKIRLNNDLIYKLFTKIKE